MTPSTDTHKTASASLIWGVLAILSACLLAFAFRIRECFVDDAFIGFQYLDNLLAGNGFTFFPGQPPVEGMTNIGWLLALAPFCTIASPTVVAKLAGLALLILTLSLTLSLGRRLAAKITQPEDAFALVFPPVLMLATSFDFTYFSLTGMETALLAAILMLMACIALDRPRSKWLPTLGAIAFSVHPEAVLVYPLYSAICRTRELRGGMSAAVRGFLADNLLLAALAAGVTAARFGYFHDFVPNTFHAKPSGWQLAVQNGYDFLMGRNTNVAFPITGWLAIPLLILGYRRLRAASASASAMAADMLAAICGVGLAFAIYSPTDWTGLARYFAPYLPAALILLWAGIGELIGLLWTADSRQRTRQTVGAAVALLLVLTNIVDCQNRMALMQVYPGYVLTAKNLIRPALWMRDHLPAEATIATRRIGVLAYYSGRKVFDYTYGLPEPEVARLVGSRGRRFDNPAEPALAALWRARAPDYLLEDGHLIDMIAGHAHGDRQRFSIHGIDYCVVRQFPIGDEVQWVLAQRIERR